MKIARRFTVAGQDPYAGIRFEPRRSEIRNPDGKVVFQQDRVMVPSTWSSVATDVLAQKTSAARASRRRAPTASR